jgi:integrase
MRTKSNEAKKSVVNLKSCPLLVHQTPVDKITVFPNLLETNAESDAVHAKTEIAFWKNRVAPRILKGGTKTSLLYFRLTHGGRTQWVNLNTANQGEAARRARNLWVACQSKGLTAALADFAPKDAPRALAVVTLADYLAAARPIATVRTTTLHAYESAIFRLVGAVRDIELKSSHRAVVATWREKVGRVRLDQITPTTVRAYLAAELATAARSGETAKDRRAHTLASDVRDAKALFSKAILRDLPKSVLLPPELPFAGVTSGATTRRFVPTIDPHTLYLAAGNLDADTRTAFDLLLLAGLRRGEADALTWQSLDLVAGLLTVGTTEFFRPKSKESHRTVPLPADLVARLRALHTESPSAVCVLEGQPLKTAGKTYHYRAKAWDALTKWLKTQGITDRTPLHTLRKMSGSWVYSRAGLEAARRHLGHATVATTAASYLAGGAVVVDFAAPTAKPAAP